MFGNPSYPTYQAFLGLGIAAAIALLLMPWWIKLLKVEGIGQQVRADGPKRHLVKQGTPTMGGVVILVAISLTCLLMGKLTTELVLVLLATLATGVLGLIEGALLLFLVCDVAPKLGVEAFADYEGTYLLSFFMSHTPRGLVAALLP